MNCPHDTNHDGDCHLCAKTGICLYQRTNTKVITPDQIKRLAGAHINHFENLLSGRSRFQINRAECEAYLGLWTSIYHADSAFLNARQKQEITAAVYSGDYDHIFALDFEGDEELDFPTIDS